MLKEALMSRIKENGFVIISADVVAQLEARNNRIKELERNISEWNKAHYKDYLRIAELEQRGELDQQLIKALTKEIVLKKKAQSKLIPTPFEELVTRFPWIEIK